MGLSERSSRGSWQQGACAWDVELAGGAARQLLPVDVTHNCGVTASMVGLAARTWWGLLVRGVAAMGLGLTAIVTPLPSHDHLLAQFALWAVVDGVVWVLVGWRSRHQLGGSFTVWGIAVALMGIGVLVRPELAVIGWVVFVMAWLVDGFAQLLASSVLRESLPEASGLMLSGIASITVGAYIAATLTGFLVSPTIAGIAAVIYGALLAITGVRIRFATRVS
jgi:uncharacterized membrane protein HdeD (DUF308 family)